MSELLCPAGNMDALIAAVSNGADAIYLGMSKFGARAYASNFDEDGLLEAVKYCHLRNVKVYVTMNTIVFDKELEDAYKQIDYLYKVGVDGVIIQDLAIFNYVVKNYPLMEAHTSTQMGIDDKEGALLFKELGAKRIVLSRECNIDEINAIKRAVKLPLEIFAHGALCVSYSGGCLMSGLIGYRSGNRGRCVGSCRKRYKLINTTENRLIADSYILSMKDLNTIDKINELKDIDSLKIEGRMKEPEYVANITRTYRAALDNKLDKHLVNGLNKTFNRTFTKGYMFFEDKKDITNVRRPNNFGYEIGYVSKAIKGGYELTLKSELNQNDIIRIAEGLNDVNLSVTRLYDLNDNLISTANNKCVIKIKEDVKIGSLVYKTKDVKFYDEITNTFPKEFRRFPIDVTVYGSKDEKMVINATCGDTNVTIESDFYCAEAKSYPLDKDSFVRSFSKMGDSIYYLNEVYFYAENIFIPVSKINELRRQLIIELDSERFRLRNEITKKPFNYDKLVFPETKELAVMCQTEEQYKAAKELGINIIYYKDNVIRRNKNKYLDKDTELLIGGYGGIYKYKDTNEYSTDHSLNCVNSEAVYTLHKLGAKRVCLSYEINEEDINNLVDDYKEKTGGYPNLEMIVYGRAPMMFTNYCPLKVYGQCGKCKKNSYILKEEYGEFPIISHDDCTTTILNGRILNLINEVDKLKHINTLRVNLTLESYDESLKIIKAFMDKMNGLEPDFKFNSETDTRGHFNKEIL